MKKGKAYFNRKEEADRPLGDFYSTPMSLVWELNKRMGLPKDIDILEPCAGQGAIVNALKKDGFTNITSFDLYHGENKQDFLTYEEKHDIIYTNPPFSLFDAFVEHGKKLAKKKLIILGRLNYFASVGRYQRNLWKGLTDLYVFNRMTDFRCPYREDGLFNVGGLVTGFFIFDKCSTNPDPVLRVLDVQKYAKLGAYKEEKVEAE
jgi:hypothetical protein